MHSIISIKDLTKTYATGFEALKRTNLEIRRGEIFGLLGPNGAGKTTLINIVCGIVNATSGTITLHFSPTPDALSRSTVPCSSTPARTRCST